MHHGIGMEHNPAKENAGISLKGSEEGREKGKGKEKRKKRKPDCGVTRNTHRAGSLVRDVALGRDGHRCRVLQAFNPGDELESVFAA